MKLSAEQRADAEAYLVKEMDALKKRMSFLDDGQLSRLILALVLAEPVEEYPPDMH